MWVNWKLSFCRHTSKSTSRSLRSLYSEESRIASINDFKNAVSLDCAALRSLSVVPGYKWKALHPASTTPGILIKFCRRSPWRKLVKPDWTVPRLRPVGQSVPTTTAAAADTSRILSNSINYGKGHLHSELLDYFLNVSTLLRNDRRNI